MKLECSSFLISVLDEPELKNETIIESYAAALKHVNGKGNNMFALPRNKLIESSLGTIAFEFTSSKNISNSSCNIN